MHYTLNPEDGRCFVAVTGDIDANVSSLFVDLEQRGPYTEIVFDCHYIARINSTGIKCWIEGMRRIEDKSAFAFRRCPPVFIEVAAMVPAFAGGHRIMSLQIGYQCKNCSAESMMLVHASKSGPILPAAPLCELCGCEVVPDAFALEQAAMLFRDPKAG